ncbi:MAG: fibronectin type III domain-containing protein [bacterium]
MKILILFSKLAILLIVGCASSLPRVKDITELAPPRNVQAVSDQGIIRISWDASSDESKPHFDGYNIYCSNKSLILVSIKHLPPPVIVDKNQHQIELQDLDRSSRYFVHVRSRDKNGDLSFPSLPEVVIQPANSSF